MAYYVCADGCCLLTLGTHDLVPAELLATAGRRQDELAQQVIALQQQLVQQAAAQQYAAGVYVERVAAQRTVGHLVEGWLRWRTAAVQGRVSWLLTRIMQLADFVSNICW